jgi:hypothetical protein
MERWVVKAVVQGKTLVLDEALPLPDGITVTVTLIPQGEISEQEFYSWLAAEGLISLPKPSPTGIRHSPPRKISGKPLSQIIIEERR